MKFDRRFPRLQEAEHQAADWLIIVAKLSLKLITYIVNLSAVMTLLFIQ